MTRCLLGAVTAALALLAWPLPAARGLTALDQDAASLPSIVMVPSPAVPNSGEPQLTTSDRGVLLSWIEHDGSKTTLRFAERTPTGWTAARTVASGDDWSINAIDVPSVVRLADGTLAAQWLQKGGSGMHANEVRLSYSSDEGRTWAPSFTAHRDATPKERLFATLFQMPGGGLGLIWLEGGAAPSGTGAPQRDARGDHGGGDHARQPAGGQRHEGHGERGAMTADHAMTLRFASFSRAWQQTAEMPIDPRVCECCPTAAVATSEGVLAAYRNRGDDEIRDIYVSRFSEGRWMEPAVVHADQWRIPACPINGPALSARGRTVAIAWYTVKDEVGHAYAAFSHDAGRSFGQPIRLDDAASLGRVDVEMLPDGSALAAWIETGEGRSHFRVRRVSTDGARSATTTVAALAGGRSGGSPRIASHRDQVVFAWTETAAAGAAAAAAKAERPAVHVRTAVVRLSSTVAR